MVCSYCSREAEFEAYWPKSGLTTYLCEDHISNAMLLNDFIIDETFKGKIIPTGTESLFPDCDGTSEI